MQTVIVAICVLAAVLFMGIKFYKTLRSKGHCDCEKTCKGKTRACHSGGCCPAQFNEIRPKKAE